MGMGNDKRKRVNGLSKRAHASAGARGMTREEIRSILPVISYTGPRLGGNGHAKTLAHTDTSKHRIHHLQSEQAQRVDARTDGGGPGINDVNSGRWMRFAYAKAGGVGLASARGREWIEPKG